MCSGTVAEGLASRLDSGLDPVSDRDDCEVESEDPSKDLLGEDRGCEHGYGQEPVKGGEHRFASFSKGSLT